MKTRLIKNFYLNDCNFGSSRKANLVQLKYRFNLGFITSIKILMIYYNANEA